MSLQNVERIEQQEVHEKSWFQRFNTKLAVGATAVSTAFVVGSAHAEGALVDGLYTKVAGDLGGVSSGTLSVITILAGVVALLIGWAYLKRAK